MPLLFQLTGNQSALNPHGPHAGKLAEMSWSYLSLFSVVWVIVMIILGVALVRARRGRFLGEAGSRNLLVYAGIVIPLAVLVGFLIYSVSSGWVLYAKPYHERGALVIKVLGKQWWWDVYYKRGNDVIARVANEIHVPVGQPVVFELESNDVIHSFWVPALAGKMDLIPGRTNYQWLQADRPGVFRGQCGEYCGAQHAHMGLEVIAQPASDFNAWLQNQRRPAVLPQSDAAERGQQVFVTGPCVMCHAVRGTQALAQVGPDLTHVASRRWLAAATLPNNRGALGGWILNSQGVKPGNHMPRITLARNDFEDLLTYLETLR